MATFGKADVLYWVGCMSSYRTMDTARTTVGILRRAGVDFTMLGKEEGCCGSVLIRTGQREPVEKEYAKANVEKILTTGAETLVTACAGCYRTFYKDYPEILGSLPFEVLHISQYLERLIRDGRIKFDGEIKFRATYHDPCHLGRHVGVYDPPRNVIKAIPGGSLVEMAKNREESRCCGAGGGVRSAFRELGVTCAVDRLKLDAVPTGAEVVVTACPFCVENFEGAIEATSIPIEVYDLPELVYRALFPER